MRAMVYSGSIPLLSQTKIETMFYKKKKTTTKTKGKTDLKAKLDREFSLFIRYRDTMPNGYFQCISCREIKPFAQADNGHYFSRTHTATRFDEDNCHAECRYCNRFKSDHLEGYRENLIGKIGQQRFDRLKWRASTSKKITDTEYDQFIKYYKALWNKLKKEKGL